MDAAPLNLELVRRRAADIRGQLSVLREYAGRDADAILANPEAIRSARYALVVRVEAAAAICNHVCARRLLVSPDSYADCFQRLADGGVIPADLGPRLASMGRLRNLLVHVYEQVDDRHFVDILRHDLGDVDAYLLAIDRLLPEVPG